MGRCMCRGRAGLWAGVGCGPALALMGITRICAAEYGQTAAATGDAPQRSSAERAARGPLTSITPNPNLLPACRSGTWNP